MGRMKDVYTELVEGIHSIDLRQTQCNANMIGLEKRLDGLLHLMSDMVKLEDQIRKMEENIDRRLTRIEASQSIPGQLVDRLIEMSLVQSGKADQAVLHRAQSRLDMSKNFFEQPDGGQEDEDVWPPPGCDAMESRG